jgi:hypothetical protein
LVGNSSATEYGGGGGGGGNGGLSSAGASISAGMGNGGNGGGGGGGGYGGGILVITADSIELQGSGQHLYVSGQKGGNGGLAGWTDCQSGGNGDDGGNGGGGLLIINSRSFPKNNTAIWNINSGTYGYLSNSSEPGHGIITGNPGLVLFNVNKYSASDDASTSIIVDKKKMRSNEAANYYGLRKITKSLYEVYVNNPSYLQIYQCDAAGHNSKLIASKLFTEGKHSICIPDAYVNASEFIIIKSSGGTTKRFTF